jgi:DNA replication protein DnaC
VGKTHLATALAVRACQTRKRVQFLAAPALLDHLLAAEVSRGLAKLLEGFGRLDLLVVDELGYLPMDSHRANLFFQLVSHLYTRTAMIITSNVAFDGWGRIFGGDEMIATGRGRDAIPHRGIQSVGRFLSAEAGRGSPRSNVSTRA